MRLKFFNLLACFFVTISGFCQQESFNIEGIVTSDYNGYIYLSYGNKTDSSLIIDRNFNFYGYVENPTDARIHLKKGYFTGYFYLENSAMKIDLSIDGSITSINSMTGNKTAVLMADMMEYFQNIQSDPEFASKLYLKLDTLISQNPNNQFSGMVLGEIAMDPILSFEQIYSLYSKLDTAAQSKNDIISLKKSMDKLKNIRIGTAFTDFELPDKNGKSIHSKDYRGSYLLVEIWSSWCAPCRKSNPELARIYESYNDYGFEILGVSIDTEKVSWMEAIEKDGLSWANTIAKEEWNNRVIKSLGIQYVPSNYLIDKNGIILAINIKPFELEKKLATILSE